MNNNTVLFNKYLCVVCADYLRMIYNRNEWIKKRSGAQHAND